MHLAHDEKEEGEENDKGQDVEDDGENERQLLLRGDLRLRARLVQPVSDGDAGAFRDRGHERLAAIEDALDVALIDFGRLDPARIDLRDKFRIGKTLRGRAGRLHPEALQEDDEEDEDKAPDEEIAAVHS